MSHTGIWGKNIQAKETTKATARSRRMLIVRSKKANVPEMETARQKGKENKTKR